MKVIYILMLLFFISCNKKVIDLTNDNILIINFNTLPNEVKSVLSENIINIVESPIETYFSINKNEEFRHERNLSTKSWLEEVNSNFHYFKINGYSFRLRGNKGHPFILYNNNLYFTELNISIDDYKKKEFYTINLNKYFK